MKKIKRYPTALTIAGSDSSGCAGIPTDLKTCSRLEIFPISAITAQNTLEVIAFEPIFPRVITKQLRVVLLQLLVSVFIPTSHLSRLTFPKRKSYPPFKSTRKEIFMKMKRYSHVYSS